MGDPEPWGSHDALGLQQAHYDRLLVGERSLSTRIPGNPYHGRAWETRLEPGEHPWGIPQAVNGAHSG